MPSAVIVHRVNAPDILLEEHDEEMGHNLFKLFQNGQPGMYLLTNKINGNYFYVDNRSVVGITYVADYTNYHKDIAVLTLKQLKRDVSNDDWRGDDG